MDFEDGEFEHSRLSGSFTLDGETVVDIEIYRHAGTQDRWRLEVVHPAGEYTTWQETFATAADAYAAFMNRVESIGTAAFASTPPKTWH